MAHKVVIEDAQYLVPRPGTQAERRELRDKLRAEDLEMAADIESRPWYDDPDSPTSGDDSAICDISYSLDRGEWINWRSYIPIRNMDKLQVVRLGAVEHHRDPAYWCEYSFHFFASFALDLLKQNGIVPQDAILSNEDERPMLYEAEMTNEEIERARRAR